MPRKRKKKKKKEPENEIYKLEVDEWEVDYHFGVNKVSKEIIPGDYWEHATLILSCKILSPTLKSAAQATINIMETPEMDDHWKREATEKPLGIGFMEIPRGYDTLIVNCWIPSRSFKNLPTAFASKKIKYARVFGTKLKWRRGKVFEIGLSTDRPEE